MIGARVLMYALYLFFVVMEIVVVSASTFRKHYSNLYNKIDGIIYISSILIFLNIEIDLIGDETGLITNSITVCYMFLVGVRGLIYLRVMDNVRYLVRMLIEVFWDMRAFLSVLAASILVLATVEIQMS